MIEIGHVSHPGKLRALNEDSYDIDMAGGIAVLVDGMGGPNAGDIASAFVRSELHKYLLQGDSPVAAMTNAGNALRQQRPQQSGRPSGACAITASWKGNTVDLAWLGSCRAWHSDGIHIRLVEALAADQGPRSAAASSPVQALGVTAPDKLSIGSARLSWQRGHGVLLCSDGILEECPEAVIRDVLADVRISAQEATEQLLLHILKGRAANNLTAILLRKV
jgi:protein phosphatase